MKFVIALVLLTCELFLCAQSDKAEILRSLQTHREPCIKESHVNVDLANRLHQNKELSEDRNFKCYLRCLLERANILSNSGELNEEAIEQFTNQGQVEKCRIERREDPCETAAVFAKCFLS